MGTRRMVLACVVAATIALALAWSRLAIGNEPPPAPRSSASPTVQPSVTSSAGPLTAQPHAKAHAKPLGPFAPPGEPVPILMYHVIAAPPAGAPYPGLYLSPKLFAQQIRYLHARGYHAVTLGAVWRYWHGRARLPKRPVVLSFDDGYRSQYTVAARVLKRYAWPGVLNLAVVHLHEGSYGVTVQEVDAMVAAGWEVDSHTVHHVDVTTLTAPRLRFEVSRSRAVLHRLFHQPVAFFCYPSGAYNATAIHAVRAAGYLGATTTNFGSASRGEGMYRLSRIRISGGETGAQLRADIASVGG
jgi:peptidoglycan/xylan/chitin deacetylase (PgdA/CDA1 family)